MLDNPPAGVLLVDVRTPAEAAQGMARGAVVIPHDQIAARLKELPRDKDIVLYCRSGRRSKIAYDVLHDAGYERIRVYEAGTDFSVPGKPRALP